MRGIHIQVAPEDPWDGQAYVRGQVQSNGVESFLNLVRGRQIAMRARAEHNSDHIESAPWIR